MKQPPQMKLWEVVSAFREHSDVLKAVVYGKRWKNPYAVLLREFAQHVRAQDRAVLDRLVPLELTREIASRCVGLRFQYSPGAGSLCRLFDSTESGSNTVVLSALEVHDRFGGSIMEQVLESGSANVSE